MKQKNIRRNMYYSGAYLHPLHGFTGVIEIDNHQGDKTICAKLYGETKQEVDNMAAAFINISIK